MLPGNELPCLHPQRLLLPGLVFLKSVLVAMTVLLGAVRKTTAAREPGFIQAGAA